MSRDLFDVGPGDLRSADRRPEIEPRDPSVPAVARPRLSRQCWAIVERLRRGPALNSELAAMALKYTGRLSDLRAAGFVFRTTAIDRGAGVFRYTLVSEPAWAADLED